MAADIYASRALVAGWFLRGKGIEVGALDNPLRVPPAARVQYIDRMSVKDLRAQYPELDALPLVEPDIIDNGETLGRINESSQDFVIANHFLEHCQNPITTLQSFMRVLKPDGVAFLVIPDKLYTFDKDRPLTPLAHIIRDHEEGPDWSREDHFREWARLVSHAEPEQVDPHAHELMERDYSIHFHVWTKEQFLELLFAVNEKYRLGFEVRLFIDNGAEGIYVLQKSTTLGKPFDVNAGA